MKPDIKEICNTVKQSLLVTKLVTFSKKIVLFMLTYNRFITIF